MGATPYLSFSPVSIVSILGMIHGPDKTIPTPKDDWRTAIIDVIIPTYNEQMQIGLCLASLAKQTCRPRKIIIIDDASKDNTVMVANDTCQQLGLSVEIIQRPRSEGKTPGLYYAADQSKSDVQFVLDGDTVLESENYIERLVQELYQGVGIASACGIILPLSGKSRRNMLRNSPVLQRILQEHPYADYFKVKKWWQRWQRAITDFYRDALYRYLQGFVYHGEMTYFGTIINPVGCAVAYRREYIKNLFDQHSGELGLDLTTSEDIFIGFSFTDYGYRNIQVFDVYARTQEPEISFLFKQVLKWSSSFFQSCYYFNDLIKTPFKSFRYWLKKIRDNRSLEQKKILEKRIIKEAYRQSFGRDYTKQYGRPIGWMIFLAAFEKISFPVTVLLMLMWQWWEPIAVVLGAEILLHSTVLGMVTKHRLRYFFQGILVTPIRYALVLYDLFVMGVFAADIWVLKNRKWRK